MKSTIAAAACTAASIPCVPCAIGQDHDHAAPLGEVSFPVSCTEQQAKAFLAKR